jgi:hypothetical protein
MFGMMMIMVMMSGSSLRSGGHNHLAQTTTRTNPSSTRPVIHRRYSRITHRGRGQGEGGGRRRGNGHGRGILIHLGVSGRGFLPSMVLSR